MLRDILRDPWLDGVTMEISEIDLSPPSRLVGRFATVVAGMDTPKYEQTLRDT